MRFSLRTRVYLLVAVVNAGMFAVAALWLSTRLEAAQDELLDDLIGNFDAVGLYVGKHIDPEGGLNVARILQWDGWFLADDAILIDNNYRRTSGGDIETDGIDLNVRGGHSRGAEFDRQSILAAVANVIETREPLRVAGGRAVPIDVPGERGGRAWGGCWLRVQLSLLDVWGNLLPIFAASTLVLITGTFFLLRFLVLEPVKELADGARHVRDGDFSVRLPEPARRDEIADLVRTFNRMTATVQGFSSELEREVEHATQQARHAEAEAMTQRRLAAMGEFAAGVAHEINNPLGGLSNAVERLQTGELSEAKRAQYLALLGDGLERIGTTVGQLLRFTPRETRPGPVDFHAVALDAIALVHHRAQAQGVEIGLSPAEASGLDLTVDGVRHELGQAVLNLLGNALDALLERGERADAPRVELAFRKLERGVELTVRDNGPGVPEAELERVADLFYTTKEVGKGSGLGLSIVHNVIESHGGRMHCASEYGRGFAVTLFVPRRAAPGGQA